MMLQVGLNMTTWTQHNNASNTSTDPTILAGILIIPVVVVALGLMNYAYRTSSRPDSHKSHLLKKISKGKQDAEKEGWRHSLGEFMESKYVSGTVIALILVDILCTVVNDLLENTDLLNPKYDEPGEKWENATYTISVSILLIFLLEQFLHIVAFGVKFFSHWWYVFDLLVVYVSLVCETILRGPAEETLALLIVLRLWKVVAFLFDVCLAKKEYDTQGAAEEQEASPAMPGIKNNKEFSMSSSRP